MKKTEVTIIQKLEAAGRKTGENQELTDLKAIPRDLESLKVVMQSLPIGLLLVHTADDEVVYLNAAAETMCGLQGEQLTGKSWTDLFQILQKHPLPKQFSNVVDLRMNGIGYSLIVLPHPSLDKLSGKSNAHLQTEIALQRSERWFRAIFEHAGIAMSIVDPTGHFIQFNDEWLAMFDMQWERLAQHTFFDLVTSEDLTKLQSAFQQIVTGKLDAYVTELRFIEQNPDLIWGEVSLSPIQHEDRIPEAIVILCTNITPRKLAEKAVNKKLEIEKIISSVSSLFVELDDFDETINASLEIVGAYSGASRSYLFLLHDNQQNLKNTHEWSASGIEPLRFRLKSTPIESFSWWNEVLTKGGKVFYNDAFALPKDKKDEPFFQNNPNLNSLLIIPIETEGKVAGFIGFDDLGVKKPWDPEDLMVLRFFSELIGNALSRKRSEMRYMRLFAATEQSADAIVITDENGIIQYVNPSFEKITGYSKEEAIGRKTSLLKSGEHSTEFYKNLWNTITRGEVWHGRLRNRKKNGEIYEDETSISPVFNAQGKIINYVSVKRNVTKERLLESQLRQAQKLEAIGQLAAGIAHEINTPIQYIGDNTHFIQDSLDDLTRLIRSFRHLLDSIENNTVSPEELEKLHQIIAEVDAEYLLTEIPTSLKQSLEGIDRITHIVQAMREFSHPGVKEKTSMDINRAIENTLTVSRNEWKYTVEIVKHLDTNLPPIHCIQADINQALLNLIVNATHAIQDKLKIHPDLKGIIEIRTSIIDNYVEIQVEDNGIGIPKSIQDRIYDPFFTTKEVGRGTGQGLAITYNVIVEKHGGTITFISKENKGTTFIVRLPISNSV